MTRINILAAKNVEQSLIWLTPLWINRDVLRDMGLIFRVMYDDEDALYDADCVFFDNRVYREWGRQSQDQKACDLLERLKGRVGKVFWLDTTDGTGTTQFQFLPHVDCYLKTQVLKDKSAYTRPYYGGRIYTDYYHSSFGVEDSDGAYCPTPAKESDLDKIRLAWNDSLGDFGPWGHPIRMSRSYVPLPLFYSAKFAEPGSRPVDVSARFGTTYSRETVAFQRQMVQKTLSKLGIATDKIPKGDYLKELRRAKVAVSPFGWGEPSYKDYEIIISGAMLLKPDVSHMATWPNLYVEGEAYLPFKWDCSDLQAVLEDALEGDRWREIATQAQVVYRKYLFHREGREEFCQRVRGIVEFQPSPVASLGEEHEPEGLSQKVE